MQEEMMQKEAKYRVLNRDVIKYIAMAAMLLNHIANVFLTHGTLLAEVFLDIGYFTAITMCYFMVEGYQYTRSKKKYGIRLLLFAIISQIPFSMAFEFGALNMIYTLFLCFLILVVREKVTNKVAQTILVILLFLLTGMGDWPFFAPMFIIMFDAWKGDSKKIWRAYGIAAIVFGAMNLMQGLMMYEVPKAILCALGSMMGVSASGLVIQFLYKGKRAEHGRNISKWFFYIFYPAHLLILALIKMWM